MCRSNRVRSVRFVGAVGSWIEREVFQGCSTYCGSYCVCYISRWQKVKSMLAGFNLPERHESRVS